MSTDKEILELFNKAGISRKDLLNYFKAEDFANQHKSPTEKFMKFCQTLELVKKFQEASAHSEIEIEYTLYDGHIILRNSLFIGINELNKQIMLDIFNHSDDIFIEKDLYVEDTIAMTFVVCDIFEVNEL